MAVVSGSVTLLWVASMTDQQIKRFSVATFGEQHEGSTPRIECLGNSRGKLLFVGVGASLQEQFTNFKKLGKAQIPGY